MSEQTNKLIEEMSPPLATVQIQWQERGQPSDSAPQLRIEEGHAPLKGGSCPWSLVPGQPPGAEPSLQPTGICLLPVLVRDKHTSVLFR